MQGVLFESFNQVIGIDPNNSKAWHYRGLVSFGLHYYSDALACYNKAIALNPNDGDVWRDRGHALDKLRRHSEAREWDERVLGAYEIYRFLICPWVIVSSDNP